jgi:hypothetical protein
MKSTIYAIIRMVLSGLGAYLLGKNLFGHAIDEILWQEIVGGIMIAISLITTVLDKTSTYEMVEGFVRQFITTLGGVALSLGVISAQTFATISGIVVALLPLILSLVGKKKSQEIAAGNLGVKDLTGVKELNQTPTPVLNTPKL